MKHSELRMRRWLSTLAIIAGVAILLFLGFQYSYEAFYRWLADQDYFLVSDRIAGFDIPVITPTSTSTPYPTLTPTSIPSPTPEPEPMPAVRIIIPKVQVNEKIIEVELRKIGSGGNASYIWEAAAYAVGHHEGSAHPGEPGNIVLSGHNNTLGSVFRRLNDLQPGDLVYLYTLDDEFVYVVDKKEIVLAIGATAEDMDKHVLYTAPTPDETLTLVSCWPWATYTHRIYVVAKPQK